MVKICPDIILPYRYVRHGDEVSIGDTRRVPHREITRRLLGPLSIQEVKAILENDPRDWDMGHISRMEDNKLDIGGISETYGFPSKALLPEVRRKTIDVLRKKYPEEIISDVTEYNEED